MSKPYVINTYYIAPTSVRAAHIGAGVLPHGQKSTVVMPLDPKRTILQNHRTAAALLADQNDWTGTWFGAERGDGGMVYQQVASESFSL